MRWDPQALGAQLEITAVRDEFLDRPTSAPRPWWPDIDPNLVGARDARAGGTSFATNLRTRTAAVLVNAAGDPIGDTTASRGVLPLRAAAGKLDLSDATAMPGFHLLVAQPGQVTLYSRDLGGGVTEQKVPPGRHILTYGGLNDEDHERGCRAAAAFTPVPGEAASCAAVAFARAATVTPGLLDGRLYGTVSFSQATLSARRATYRYSTAVPFEDHWKYRVSEDSVQ